MARRIPTPPITGHDDPVAHVLLVDDDPAVLGAYARWLRRAGYLVTTAPGLEEAVRALTGGDVDVVVTDMNLIGGSGLDVLEAVRADWPELPVLFVTASTELTHAVQALERGALRYLSKPIDPEGLCLAIDSARRVVATLGGPAGPRGRDLANLDVRFDAALAGLALALQPIVRWPERQVLAYEALVRSREASLRRPDRLFAAAETLGRLHDLGRAIRREAAAVIPSLPPGVDLHVNVHPRDLADDDLLDHRAPLSRHASRVVLELTERTALARVPDLGDRMVGLRRLGYRFALDDLGAGYTALASATLTRPDLIKLDGSLVRGVSRDPARLLVVRSVQDVCARLGLTLVCESVEDVADLEVLAASGCDRFQGHLFARPGSAVPDVMWPTATAPSPDGDGLPDGLAAETVRAARSPRTFARGTDQPMDARTQEWHGRDAIATMLAREARSRLDAIAAAAEELGARGTGARDAIARGIADSAEEVAGTLAALIEIFEASAGE